MFSVGRQSFAAKCAQKLRAMGFLLYFHMGYIGLLDAKLDHKAGHKHYHKYSELFSNTPLEFEIKAKWVRLFF
jgi:hypothetical protein